MATYLLLMRAKRCGELTEADSCVCPNLFYLLYSILSYIVAKISIGVESVAPNSYETEYQL